MKGQAPRPSKSRISERLTAKQETEAKKPNPRYPVLSAISRVLILPAVAVILVGLYFAFYAGLIEPLMEGGGLALQDVREIGIGAALTILGLLVIAAGEIIRVAFAIEQNTRETAEKLEKVQQPYFRTVEDYYRKHNKFPETILVVTRDALEVLNKEQDEAGRVYDGWVRIHEAVRNGLAAHLDALGDQRGEVWKSAVKLGAGSKDPDVRRAFQRDLGHSHRGLDVPAALVLERQAIEVFDRPRIALTERPFGILDGPGPIGDDILRGMCRGGKNDEKDEGGSGGSCHS